MKKDTLKGITVDGVPLKKCLACEEKEDPVDKDVLDEFRRNRHHIYKPKNIRFPERYGNYRRNITVENKVFFINKANIQRNIHQALDTKDAKLALVSVMLTREDPTTLVQMFDIIRNIAIEMGEEKKIFFSAHSLRNHIGFIMKSKLGVFFDVLPKGQTSIKYLIKSSHKDRFTVPQAMELVNSYSPPKYKRRAKETVDNEPVEGIEEVSAAPENKLASFLIEVPGGKELRVNIFGKIQIEFSFK